MSSLANNVSVLPGNGDGTFQNQVTYSTGSHPQCVLSADLNNDTKQDLAVTDFFDNSVSVLLGNGDGTFQKQIIYTVGRNPNSMTIGTFKDPTKIDLAVANYADNNVRIVFNSCS